MARWKPADNGPIEPKERIGRRLFDEPMLAGAEGQRPFQGLQISHFEEKRSRQISVDRLGRTGIERAVVKYLTPRANEAATKFNPPKFFNGWAVLTAEKIAKSPKCEAQVVPSPVEGEGLTENIFHAHILRPEGIDDYYMALHLRHLVEKHGEIHEIPPQPSHRKRVKPDPAGGLGRRWVRLKRLLRL